MKNNFTKFLSSYIISFCLSFLIGLAIFSIDFFVNNSTMYAAINGASLSAIILLSVGGLMFVAGEGFFDIFAYGFKQVGSSIFSKKANSNNNFAEYKDQQRIKQDSKPRIFLCILTSGIIFLIAAIVLRIIEG